MVNIELEINDTIHLKITGHVHEYNNLKNEDSSQSGRRIP